MKWEFFVSLRYLFSKRKEKLISLTTVLSIASVVIGVSALIIVLAVMNGFGDKLREKIVGFNYHIQIEKPEGIKNPYEAISRIKEEREVVSASAFIDGQAIALVEEREPRGIFVRGIDPSTETGLIDINMAGGRLELGDGEVGVGNELAKLLGISIGDRINLISGAKITPSPFRVSSIFHSGMYEYDANVAFMNLGAAKTLFGTEGSVHGIGVKVKRLDIAGRVKRAILAVLGRGYLVNTWSELNRNLFAAIKMEKILVFIVVTLTIAVGALNIVNTLSLLTMEKTKDIGILKAFGAARSNIANIYIFKGLAIGLIGSSLGLFFGLLITGNINPIANLISKLTGFELFSKSIYYLDEIPVSVNYSDIGIIISCAILLSFLATLYPAWHASRLDPVEALRYE